MRRLMLKSFLAICLFSLSAADCSAQSAPGDYDGDGTSDLAVALVDRQAGSTAWLVRPTSGAQQLYWTFSVPGDALITGRFFPDGRVYPGVVHVKGSRLPLEWRIKTPEGQEVQFSYGLPGDTIPNLGDLDCDGITDPVVVRSGTPSYYPGFRLWYVLLSGWGYTAVQDVFGLAGDRLMTADMDGDGCSEMVALRGSTYVWYSKKLFSQGYTQVQWGLPGDIPLLPQDMDGDNRPDYIVARPTGAGQVAYVRNQSGGWDIVPLGFDTSVPSLGRFGARTGFTWAERATGWAAIRLDSGALDLFRFGIPANAIIRPDGTVIQPNETGRFGAWEPVQPQDNGVDCDRDLDITDGSGGFKSNAANSRGTLKLIFPSFMSEEIEVVRVYTSAGVLYDTMRYGQYEWGERQAFYGTKRLSVYPANITAVAEMSDGERICATIPNPQRTYD